MCCIKAKIVMRKTTIKEAQKMRIHGFLIENLEEQQETLDY